MTRANRMASPAGRSAPAASARSGRSAAATAWREQRRRTSHRTSDALVDAGVGVRCLNGTQLAALGVGSSAIAVAARGDNAVRVVQRGGNGSLQLVSITTVGAGPDALLPLAVNGDTHPDLLVVANHDDNTVSVLSAPYGVPKG